MPTDRASAPTMTVVLDPGHHTQASRPVLEMRGRLDGALFQAALDRIALGHPTPPTDRLRLHRHGPDHHTLELPSPAGASSPYPAGLLADLLTSTPVAAPDPAPAADGELTRVRTFGPLPRTFAVTPLQRELLADALTGPDQQVEQLAWRWHGPLETRRFTAAWRAVFDCETVLRSAFVWDPQPRAVLFDTCAPDVARHTHGAFAGREDLMAAERSRGFDLRRPGLLRIALLDGPPAPSFQDEPATDMVLTYHRALLDSWSVRVLVRAFYRAYLAGGSLPGGERRPDLRDYTRWLDRQDPAPARDFWRRTAAVAPAPLTRAAPGEHTGQDGVGRSRTRLSRAETTRLTHWAARWGATESSALHAVWAMLLYRASGAVRGPVRVGFHVSFSGRGILLEDIERIPGPFANPLPVSVEVDPAGTVARLLRDVRDRAIDTAAYEWVPDGRIQQWLGRADGTGPAETLLAFEHTPRRDERLTGALAAHGVNVEHPVPAVARTASALGVLAHHDGQGGLVLSAVHDRERLEDDKTQALFAQSAGLLRRLPSTVRESTTVAEVLDSLDGLAMPRLHERRTPREGVAGMLLPLRAAAVPGVATICLVTAPGAPEAWYRGLVRCYDGPEELVVLRASAAVTRHGAAALAPVAGAGGRLVLGGFSGAGAVAYEIARHLADAGRDSPLVVLGSGEDDDGARRLARVLREAVRY
ncbi:condensation domain-containing protein [Streptomyces sp. NPDC004542]|uniref:condensation domain-containing protein n=1 Tax=Streptomyces sp. NPDC004542 TaxID=3154281 RepID=UPI0033A04B85